MSNPLVDYWHNNNRLFATLGCDQRISLAFHYNLLNNLCRQALKGNLIPLCNFIFPFQPNPEMKEGIIEIKRHQFLIRIIYERGADYPFATFSLHLCRVNNSEKLDEEWGYDECFEHIHLLPWSQPLGVLPWLVRLGKINLDFWYDFLRNFPQRNKTDILFLELKHIQVGLAFPHCMDGRLDVSLKSENGIPSEHYQYRFNPALPNLENLVTLIEKCEIYWEDPKAQTEIRAELSSMTKIQLIQGGN